MSSEQKDDKPKTLAELEEILKQAEQEQKHLEQKHFMVYPLQEGFGWAVNDPPNESQKQLIASFDEQKKREEQKRVEVLAGEQKKNEQTISQLIAQGEGHTIEFKETLEYSVRDKKQDKNLNKECLKAIAAFLNTDGGTLLIGVRDNGEITGIERDLPYVQRKNEDGFQLKLRDLIKSNFTPFPSGKVHIRFENFTKETVCGVDVEPVNKNQIICFGKDVYIRDGNTKRKLEGRDLTDWVQQRGK
jgi:hypothetical protein